MKILLVDDEEIILKSLGGFLRRCGHHLKTASDGLGALRCMEEEPPDLVISDIRMPGIDGIGLLEKLKVRFPVTPVVLITGHGNVDTAVSALQKGAYDYIRKPVKLEDLVAVLDRIEERKRLEKTLMQERAKLAHAGRLATVGVLAAGIAHEINNPTTMIRGNLQTFRHLYERVEPTLRKLCADGEGDLSVLVEEMPGLVSGMLTGTERISRIVQQVKLFSGLEHPLSPERTDLARCIDDALDLVSASLKGISVTRRQAKAEVIGVAPELTQVFVNLIHNAAQAIGEVPGGEIKIETVLEGNGWVKVSVIDNGPGIPERLWDKIFNPFFTTKDPGQGTGLGLAICHRIAVEHGGHVAFLSGEGEGACFWVRLPCAAEAGASHSSGVSCARRPVDGRGRALPALPCGEVSR